MNITIYTKSNCPQCTKAKMLLDQRGIEYTTYKLQESESDESLNLITREELLEKFPSVRMMPVITLDGKLLKSVEELHFALNAKSS